MSDNAAPTNGHTYAVDPAICIGCGICVSVCPTGYAMQADGKSKVTLAGATTDPAMEEALGACPVGAIKHI